MLARLGWTRTPAWQAAFEPFEADGLVPGRVALEHNHVYRVLTAEGETLAEAAGGMKFRAAGRAALPAVGDWVALRPGGAGARAQIRHILPRRTTFSRRASGRETTEQVVAANIDTVFVVFGLDGRASARAIERYLVVARRSGAAPVIVLNKSDLAVDVAAAVERAGASADRTPVIAVSAVQGTDLDRLEAYLEPGATIGLVGPSGSGKSSLVNRLAGREVLPTGEVRAWDARGRHTSVHRQLVLCERGGLVIDTPGMRELQLWDRDVVPDAFTDIQELADACRFRDCRHDREPGCAVKAGVDAGLVSKARYDSFLQLQAEQTAVAREREARMTGATRAGRADARPSGRLRDRR